MAAGGRCSSSMEPARGRFWEMAATEVRLTSPGAQTLSREMEIIQPAAAGCFLRAAESFFEFEEQMRGAVNLLRPHCGLFPDPGPCNAAIPKW